MGAVYEKNVNFSKVGYERKPKNLYITTASMYNSLNFNNTVRFLEDNFIQRKKTDKEMWLLGTDIEMDMDVDSRSFYNTKIKHTSHIFTNVRVAYTLVSGSKLYHAFD